jgi:serine protease Do
MRYRLFSVIVTAAVTSIATLFIANRLQLGGSRSLTGSSNNTLPVNYAGYMPDGTAKMAPNSFEMAAESSVKAVVHIKTATKGRTVVYNNGDINDMFSQLFGQRQYSIPPQMGSGSGVIISQDGYIVTNNHVIADANEITVTFNDRRTATAKVIGSDPATDIALLKVDEGNSLPYMEFTNSDEAKLGQWVLAVGYPLSLDATVTAGIISAKGRSIGVNKQTYAIESFIQTDAAVNPGNSGGALVNTAGQLIGINAAIASPTGSYAGYSYAIPSNIVKKAVNDLMKYGSVQRAYLGIEYVDRSTLSEEQKKDLGIENVQQGVYVMKVRPNGAAAKAGMLQGDIITQINGQPVNSQPEVQEQIARYHPGDNISITFLRNGKTRTDNVQLTNLNGTTDIVKAENALQLLGATFRPLTDNEKSKYQVDGGVQITEIGRGAIAHQTQMHKGFVILGINNIPIRSMSDLQQALTSQKNIQISGFYPGYQGMYYYGLNNVDDDGN